jgi:hypothetical protein
MSNYISNRDIDTLQYLEASLTTLRKFSIIESIFDFLFSRTNNVGPLRKIVSIVLLILLFPVTIIVSMVGIIRFIIYLLLGILQSILGSRNSPEVDIDGISFALFHCVMITAPFIVVSTILCYVQDILDNLSCTRWFFR